MGLPQTTADPQRIIRAARAAEDAGLWGAYFMDHLQSPIGRGPVLDGWTCGAIAASVTSRIRIVSLVSRAGLRPAAVLAAQARVLEDSSEGRLITAIGLGDPGVDHAYGAQPGSDQDFVASVEAIRKACPQMDVWGAGGPATERRLARHVDAWHWWGDRDRIAEFSSEQLWWGDVWRGPVDIPDRIAGVTWWVRGTDEAWNRLEALR